MKILRYLKHLPPHSHPSALTIGTFDGVHLGHQKIFQTARSLIQEKGRLIAVTFDPSPFYFFNPEAKFEPITPLPEKVLLLQKMGIDVLYILPFDQEMAEKTYDQFLKELQERTQMSYLVLGSDATFGKGKKGDRKNVEALAKTLAIETHYILKDHISSSKVRAAIAQKNYREASALLGRPYPLEESLR